MFINVNDVFDEKKKKSFPKPVLEYLNSKLPGDLRYVEVAPGKAIIEGFEKITGLTPVITDEMHEILGETYTFEDVCKLAYNMQTTIEFASIKDGVICLDEHEISVHEFCKSSDWLQFAEGKFYAEPPRFRDPVLITIAGNGYEKQIYIKQQPYPSISEVKYANTIDDGILFEFIIDEKSSEAKITCSYDLSKVNKVQDILEICNIYKAFATKDLLIDSETVTSPQKKKEINSHIEEIIDYCSKLRQIEIILSKTFSVDLKEFTYSQMRMIECIYQNLVFNKPTKEIDKIHTLVLETNDENDVLDLKKKKVAFSYETELVFRLFGVELKLPTIVGLFNCECSVRKDKETYKVTIVNDDYYSTFQTFKSKEELSKVYNEKSNIIEYMNDYVDVSKGIKL